jgi:hypothetical protein
MGADEVDYVLGVDTHRDQHMLAAVTAPTGAVAAGEEVSADARGYRAALRFAATLRGRPARVGDRGQRQRRGRPRPVIWPSAARPCSSAAARRRANAGCAARMTYSTRCARRGPRWQAAR